MPVITPEWVKDAVFYQIFPDRFAKSDRVSKTGLHFEAWDSPPTTHGFKGGDLLGVAEHLDYLQDLGINAIYFNPVFASASNHRYHTYDYLNVDPLLGGNAAFRELIDAAHSRNIYIVPDGVFNHASRGFWQFHHVLETGIDSPYRDWFYFDPDRLNRLRNFGAYPDPQAQDALNHHLGSFKAIGYAAWWDLPALPKFNTNTPAVREFLFNIAEYWIKFGVDGWRLDVAAEINDDSFWHEFRRRVKAANPDAYIVAEIWHEAQRWLQGDQFDATMNYLVAIACMDFFASEHLDLQEAHRGGNEYRQLVRPIDAREFADQIDHLLGLYDPGITQVQLNLLDSHDTPRFLTCVSGNKDSYRLSLLFTMTYPGAPCIYYGDEIGMAGRQDPECRGAFQWDEAHWDLDLRNFVKKCIDLRKAQPALRRGSYHRLYSQDGVFVFGRWLGAEKFVIAFNASTATQSVDIPVSALQLTDGSLVDVWNTDFRQPVVSGKLPELKLAPRSGMVLSQ